HAVVAAGLGLALTVDVDRPHLVARVLGRIEAMVDEAEGGGADRTDQFFRLTGLDAVDAVPLDRTAAVGRLEPGDADAAVLEEGGGQGLIRRPQGPVEGGEQSLAPLEAGHGGETALGVDR